LPEPKSPDPEPEPDPVSVFKVGAPKLNPLTLSPGVSDAGFVDCTVGATVGAGAGGAEPNKEAIGAGAGVVVPDVEEAFPKKSGISPPSSC
jgi:hypothetical protein